MKWLFSPSSPADPSRSADGDDRNDPPTEDEESSAIETPQKSYSAVRVGDAAMRGAEDDDEGAARGAARARTGEPIRVVPRSSRTAVRVDGAASRTGDDSRRGGPPSGGERRRRRRGVIYYRPIRPSDRAIIQGLHEQWFPVDYKSDFFDALCGDGGGDDHQQQRRRAPGVYGHEPLYCCVACFRELGDVEYEERSRRREAGRLGWASSLWPSGRRCGGGDGDDDDDDEGTLWEIDESTGDGGGRGGDSAGRRGASPTPNSTPAASAINNDAKDEDADVVESGKSVFSIHHRTETERMKRFYTNGFRFEGNDARVDRSDGTNQQQQNSNDNRAEAPHHDHEGERIVGCIVGAFLPSTMPSTKHRSSLDEKLPARDETASLLVPDGATLRYAKTFYIMTLGTSDDFRRSGLGTALVERVANMIAREREECGALYLHVITYNEGAIRLYERLGFARVKVIKDYYTINSVNYDCYLYARYFHGNRGHKTTLGVLYDLAASVVRKLSHAFVPAA